MRRPRVDGPPRPGRPPAQLYNLGRGTCPLADVAGFAWPYGVDYDAAGGRAPLWVWEGVAHGHAAARLSLAEASAPSWRSHLERCGVVWLVPLLKRAAAGGDVGWVEVERAYVLAHGRPPERVA